MALMSLELPTMQNLLTECLMVAPGDHEFTSCNTSYAHDRDALTCTAYCSRCQQLLIYRIDMTALHAKMSAGDFEGFARVFVQELYNCWGDVPCTGKGTISAIAQWLTDKLVEGPLDRQAAEYMWSSEGEDWDRELVGRVAQELGFAYGLCYRLPAEHPLATAA